MRSSTCLRLVPPRRQPRSQPGRQPLQAPPLAAAGAPLALLLGALAPGLWPLGLLWVFVLAALIMTDSGGLQEETTALGIPCLTLRENTERPVTLDEGSNVLAGTDPAKIIPLALDAIRNGGKRGRRPALWDGKAADRIAQHMAMFLAVRRSARDSVSAP